MYREVCGFINRRKRVKNMGKSIVNFLRDSWIGNPEKCACADEISAVSYRELWEDSHTTAYNLLKRVQSGMPVPVVMKKSCMALKLIWGVIKAGGCYVVIDPLLPKKRIENILNTLEAKWIIGEQNIRTKIPAEIQIYSGEKLLRPVNGDRREVDKRTEQICDIDPMYIMFTSGSTGEPKGIAVSHRSVMDFIEYFTELFQMEEQDVIGNQAPWDFDVSVKDIFSAAKVGATLQIIPKKLFSMPVQLADFLDDKKVTTLIWAVTALCILSSTGALKHKRPEAIKRIIFSGEVMPVKQYNLWREYYLDAMFVNVYGPTEITCNCTYYFVDRLFDEEEVIPIGIPFPNERVFLLDDKDCLIENRKEEKGRVGEICVSGTAVTLGYYNNQRATNAGFMQNPLNEKYMEMIYRTGDLGYYNQEGLLCFASRKDFQIKHMGHRIELGEIERIAGGIEEVERCCCLYRAGEICLFYEGAADRKAVVSALRKKLPVFMIPGKILNVEAMPVNKNGKTDRGILEGYLE